MAIIHSMSLFFSLASVILSVSPTPACVEIDCKRGYCATSRDNRGGVRYICICEEGHEGERCDRMAGPLKERIEREADDCDGRCLNGGTCVYHNGYSNGGNETGSTHEEITYCYCAPEFTGPNCSVEVLRDCLVSYCSNCSANISLCSECIQGYHLQDDGQCMACSIENCLECSKDKLCRRCKNGYTLTNNNNSSQCVLSTERDCVVRNCSICSTNSNVCDTCTEGYTLTKNNTCRMNLTSTECSIDGCRVCSLNSDSCEECEGMGAEFDSSLKRCIIKSEGSDEESSLLDLNAIIIIGGAGFLALMVMMTVLILCCLLVWRCQSKKRNRTITFNHPRHASAEMFDRIHSSYSLPVENIKVPTPKTTDDNPFDLNQETPDSAQEQAQDEGQDESQKENSNP